MYMTRVDTKKKMTQDSSEFDLVLDKYNLWTSYMDQKCLIFLSSLFVEIYNIVENDYERLWDVNLLQRRRSNSF